MLCCRYVATTAGRHDLIPDGSMDLLWIEGVGTVLCGPDTRSWSFELPQGTEVAGIRFRPGAATGVFRLEAADIRDLRVELADVLGDRDDRVLAERLETCDNQVERMGLLEDLVRRRTDGADPDGMVELAALVATDPAYGAEAVAAQAGMSSRQLRRRFDRTVGYGPAFFARVTRLQRFAGTAVRWPTHGIAELAALAGYADQAHLAKDCRAIAGMTPRQLIDVLPRSSLVTTLRNVRSVQDVRAGIARPSAA